MQTKGAVHKMNAREWRKNGTENKDGAASKQKHTKNKTKTVVIGVTL